MQVMLSEIVINLANVFQLMLKRTSVIPMSKTIYLACGHKRFFKRGRFDMFLLTEWNRQRRKWGQSCSKM